MNTPGATIMHTGEDLKKEEEAFVILAENGDIQLKAANGKIRIIDASHVYVKRSTRDSTRNFTFNELL